MKQSEKISSERSFTDPALKEDRFADESFLIEAESAIFDALLEGAGLQHIVDIGSEKIGNPIFINDNAYKNLAMSYNATFSDSTLEDQKTLGYIHEENIKGMKLAGNLIKKIADSDTVLSYHVKEKNENWLFKSVKLNGLVIAYIGVVDNNREFKQTDIRLLERFALAVSVEMSRTSLFKENAGLMYSYLLLDLILGNIKSAEEATHRCELIRWTLGKWFQIYVIGKRDLESEYVDLRYVGRELHNLVPMSRWAVYEERLVLFFSSNDSAVLDDRGLESLSSFIDNNGLIAGASDVFTDVTESPLRYTQALHALEISFDNESSPVFYYQEHVMRYISNILLKNSDIKEYLHPAVSSLIMYDSKYRSNLTETLAAFLTYPDDSAQAAKSLCVHRNTFLYRLNRIREISGSDLKDGDERLKMHLSLKLIDFNRALSRSDTNLKIRENPEL